MPRGRENQCGMQGQKPHFLERKTPL